MALPTSGNLSVRDVGAEIGLSGTYSLADCFTNAIAGGFNPTYGSITDTNLRAFLGYAHNCNTVYSFPFRNNSGSGWASAFSACSGAGASSETTLYSDTSGVANGDTVYTDSGGCTAFNGQNKYWIQRDGGSFYSMFITGAGVVSSKTLC